jgi:hypothetical protein
LIFRANVRLRNLPRRQIAASVKRKNIFAVKRLSDDACVFLDSRALVIGDMILEREQLLILGRMYDCGNAYRAMSECSLIRHAAGDCTPEPDF